MQPSEFMPASRLDRNTIVRLPASYGGQFARMVCVFDEVVSFRLRDDERLVRIGRDEVVEVVCRPHNQADMLLEMLASTTPQAMPDTLSAALSALQTPSGSMHVDVASLVRLLAQVHRQQHALHALALRLVDEVRDERTSALRLLQSDILGTDEQAQAAVDADIAALERQQRTLVERLHLLANGAVPDDMSGFGPWWPGDEPAQFTVLGVVGDYQYVRQHPDVAAHPAILRRQAYGPLRRYVPVAQWSMTPESQTLLAG